MEGQTIEILVVKSLPDLTVITFFEDNRQSAWRMMWLVLPNHLVGLNSKFLLSGCANSKLLEIGSRTMPAMQSLLPSGFKLHLSSRLISGSNDLLLG